MNNGEERQMEVVVHGGGGRRVSQAFVRRLAFWGWGEMKEGERD